MRRRRGLKIRSWTHRPAVRLICIAETSPSPISSTALRRSWHVSSLRAGHTAVHHLSGPGSVESGRVSRRQVLGLRWMAYSCDACSSFLPCSCLMVDMLTRLAQLTWPMAGQSLSIPAKHLIMRDLCDSSVRLTRPVAHGPVGASCCFTRDLLQSSIMRTITHFSVKLLTRLVCAVRD